MSLTIHGYLEQPYLTTPYLSSTAELGGNMQVQRVIAAAPATRSQASRVVTKTPPVSSQVKLQIVDHLTPDSSQVQRVIATAPTERSQVNRVVSEVPGNSSQANLIIAATPAVHSQVQRTDSATKILSSQVSRLLSNPIAFHLQVLRGVSPSPHVGMSVMPNTFLHEICDEYLVKPYLATPYLANDICAHGRFQVQIIDTQTRAVSSQVQRIISKTPPLSSQVLRTINGLLDIGSQVLRYDTKELDLHSQVQRVIAASKILRSQINRIITFPFPVHMQAQLVHAIELHMQATMVLYNTTNLRIMKDFPSRGNNGINWTASSTKTGDFSANNLNTDIVEQIWRSADADVAMVTLICDTQLSQGVFVDTVAILNHNLTKSAVVILQGSSDPTFATVGLEVTLQTTLQNMYYIAPHLPSAGYRYYRFILEDNTNTAGFLSIGTIIFGSSIIFIGDDIANPITFGRRHFKDTIVTEGYTSVSNDRALKAYLKLLFRDLDFKRGNYAALTQLFQTARTQLKCLWIPTPQYPTRFTVFGKLTQIPEESHIDNGEDADIINLDTEVDESL